MNRRHLVIALFAMALGAPPLTARAAGLDLASCRMVDLTHPFDQHTLYWPTSPSTFKLDRLSYGATPGGWFYAANALCAPEANVTGFENLAGLEALPPRGATVIALPMKIAGGSGGPLRAVALVPKR